MPIRRLEPTVRPRGLIWTMRVVTRLTLTPLLKESLGTLTQCGQSCLACAATLMDKARSFGDVGLPPSSRSRRLQRQHVLSRGQLAQPVLLSGTFGTHIHSVVIHITSKVVVRPGEVCHSLLLSTVVKCVSQRTAAGHLQAGTLRSHICIRGRLDGPLCGSNPLYILAGC